MRPLDQGPDDRTLVARRQVGTPALQLAAGKAASRVEQRRLHAGEGEVEPVESRHGEGKRLRVAVCGEPVEGCAARVAESEQPRALVERLAGGVVDRRPDRAVARVVANVEEKRVPAGLVKAVK